MFVCVCVCVHMLWMCIYAGFTEDPGHMKQIVITDVLLLLFQYMGEHDLPVGP